MHTLYAQDTSDLPETDMGLKIRQELAQPKSDVQVAVDLLDIEISTDIDAIENDWEYLEKEGNLTPFQTKAWLLPLYAILASGKNAKPLFVLVRDKVTRKPLMLLALCTRSHYGMTIIEFADFGVCDYNAPLISRIFTPSASQWQALWHGITKRLKRGTVFWLKKMPAFIGDLPNPLVLYGQKLRQMDVSTWGVALPATFAEYNKKTLNSTFSKELAKKSRRIANRGEVTYAIAKTPEEKQEVFKVLARQRQARCDEMKRTNNMAQPLYRRFYEAVTAESPGSLASMRMMKVGGKIIGVTLALHHRKAVHILMSTYESGEWKSCSLGNVSMLSAVEHAIGSGAQFFDLTIGNEGYKKDFGTTPSSLYFTILPLAFTCIPVALIMECGVYVRRVIRKLTQNDGHTRRKKLSGKTQSQAVIEREVA